jgi:hypothetical protein
MPDALANRGSIHSEWVCIRECDLPFANGTSFVNEKDKPVHECHAPFAKATRIGEDIRRFLHHPKCWRKGECKPISDGETHSRMREPIGNEGAAYPRSSHPRNRTSSGWGRKGP